MGFSVSGSLVIVLLGLFIALGAFYGSLSNSVERVVDAESDRIDRMDRVAETGVEITGVDVVNATSCDVEVTAENAGETTLDVNETDLLYDNEYRTAWRQNATVDGEATDLWHPGAELTLTTHDHVSPPERVKLVAGPGVASTEVASLSC